MLDLLFWLVASAVMWYAWGEHKADQAKQAEIDTYALAWETLDEDEPSGKGGVGR